MKCMMLAVALTGLISSSLFADQWIGKGAAGIPRATIKAIRVFNDGVVAFWINEYSTSIPDDRYWSFNSTTPGGKSLYALLLSGKTSGASIYFYETDQSGGNYSISVVEILD